LMFCPREVGPLVVGGLMGGGHAVSPLRRAWVSTKKTKVSPFYLSRAPLSTLPIHTLIVVVVVPLRIILLLRQYRKPNFPPGPSGAVGRAQRGP